jgi:hypothetical protein
MYVGNICLNDHPNLVTNCKRVFSIHKTLHDKSIKRKTIHHFLFYVDFPLSPTLLLTDLTTRWVSNKKQELLTLREYMVISDFCGCYELLIFLVLCVVLCSVLLYYIYLIRKWLVGDIELAILTYLGNTIEAIFSKVLLPFNIDNHM